jgi:hypothetical protein
MNRIVAGLFFAVILLVPWSRPPALPWLHPRAQWSDVLLLLALLGFVVSRRRPFVSWHPVHVAYGLYLASATFSWWGNGASHYSGSKLLGLWMLVALASLVASFAARPAGARLIARATAASVVVVAAVVALGVVLFYGGFTTPLVGSYGDLIPGTYPRMQAGFTHPNLLASWAIVAAGIVASRGAFSRRTVHGLWLTLGFVTLWTFSRGLLGFILVVLVARATTPRRRLVAAAWCAFSLAIVAALTFGTLSFNPAEPWAVEWTAEPSTRGQLLASAATTLTTHPWLGLGPGAASATMNGLPWEAHFTPLNVAATIGIPGLVAFLAIPLVLWRARARPTDLAIWGAVLALLIDGLAQDIEDFRHLWILLGWTAGLSSSSRPDVAVATPTRSG